MQEFSDLDYGAFKQKVLALAGVRLDDYKPDQMRRRIANLAIRSGATSYMSYYTLLVKSPAELTVFLDKMTINVSELFRNPERFDDLQNTVIPQLVRDRGGWHADRLQIWSAGCSIGAEAYSLAIMVAELGKPGCASFWATDIDQRILHKARSGRFAPTELRNVSAARLNTFFERCDNGYIVNEKIRSLVEWARHDLLVDQYPVSQFDLILCRNVVIYFTEEAKHRVYKGLHDALRPGGVLFIGGTERIAQWRDIGFDLVMPYFYRKPLQLDRPRVASSMPRSAASEATTRRAA